MYPLTSQWVNLSDVTHIGGIFIDRDSMFFCGGDWVARRRWVNFQCRDVHLLWIIMGQGPIALAVGAGGGCLAFFLSSIFSLFFLLVWETARYSLKHRLKGPLNPKPPPNQPTKNQSFFEDNCDFSRGLTKCIC